MMLLGSESVLVVAKATIPVFSVRCPPPPSVKIASPSLRTLFTTGPPTTSKLLPTNAMR